MHKCKLCGMSFYEYLKEEICYHCIDIVEDLSSMETVGTPLLYKNTVACSGVLFSPTNWHEVFKDEHYSPFDDYIDYINGKKK